MKNSSPLVAFLVNADIHAGLLVHPNLSLAVAKRHEGVVDGLGRLIHTLVVERLELHVDDTVVIPPLLLPAGTLLLLTVAGPPANVKMPNRAPATASCRTN